MYTDVAFRAPTSILKSQAEVNSTLLCMIRITVS